MINDHSSQSGMIINHSFFFSYTQSDDGLLKAKMCTCSQDLYCLTTRCVQWLQQSVLFLTTQRNNAC